MASSLLNHVNDLVEGIYKNKYKYEHDDTNFKLVELDTKVVTTFLNTKTSKMI